MVFMKYEVKPHWQNLYIVLFKSKDSTNWKYVVVNLLWQKIFVSPLFLGMEMYANEVKTKEK